MLYVNPTTIEICGTSYAVRRWMRWHSLLEVMAARGSLRIRYRWLFRRASELLAKDALFARSETAFRELLRRELVQMERAGLVVREAGRRQIEYVVIDIRQTRRFLSRPQASVLISGLLAQPKAGPGKSKAMHDLASRLIPDDSYDPDVGQLYRWLRGKHLPGPWWSVRLAAQAWFNPTESYVGSLFHLQDRMLDRKDGLPGILASLRGRGFSAIESARVANFYFRFSDSGLITRAELSWLANWVVRGEESDPRWVAFSSTLRERARHRIQDVWEIAARNTVPVPPVVVVRPSLSVVSSDRPDWRRD